jgi:hypothetical protein
MSRAKLPAACILFLAIVTASSYALAATATLSIAGRNCVGSDGRVRDYLLRVTGETGYYQAGMRVEVRLWGEDSFSDDFLASRVVVYETGQSSYTVDFCLSRSTLDEDVGEDDIYAGVRVFDLATGRQTEITQSNRIYRYF